MRHLLAGALLALFSMLRAHAAGPTLEQLKALGSMQRCEQASSGHVVYQGDSTGLGTCLDGFALERIDELRITSPGGGAWETLDIVQRYAGRIDLVVVDGLCASSCANYVIPAARRLQVMPGSYVLLHGSPNLRDLDPQEADTRAKLIAGLRAQDEDENEAELEAMADAAWKSMRDEVIAKIPVQQAWASEVLACEDWLDPHRHLDEPLPRGTAWLLVTPEMARRCLKATQIADFWVPEPGAEFARELGFLRARR